MSFAKDIGISALEQFSSATQRIFVIRRTLLPDALAVYFLSIGQLARHPYYVAACQEL